MKKPVIRTIAALAFALCSAAQAQEFVPATSEDIDMFDQQLARQLEKQKANEGAAAPRAQESKQPSAFGTAVNEEAKKLKESGDGSKKEFGKWVSGQRSKSDDGRPADAGSSASASGKDKAADRALSRGAGDASGPAEGRGAGRGRSKDK